MVRMDKVRNELLQGTLDLLILRTLTGAALHGWDIAKRIAVVSNDRLSLKQGSLYPALHRLENRRLLKAEWKDTETGREAKFYRLTPKGRTQLESEAESWGHLREAIERIMRTAEGESA